MSQEPDVDRHTNSDSTPSISTVAGPFKYHVSIVHHRDSFSKTYFFLAFAQASHSSDVEPPHPAIPALGRLTSPLQTGMTQVCWSLAM